MATLALGLMTLTAGAATLDVFDDRLAFDAASTTLSTDDFEDLGVAADAVLSLPNSVSRGDFTYTASAGALVGLGSGIGGLTSVGFAPDLFVQSLTIDPGRGITSFGFDFTATFASTLSIQVFDIVDNLLDTFSVATGPSLSFFGFTSDMEIGSVLFDDGNAGGPIVDNIAAGTALAPVPLPATGLFLIGGLAALGAASRRKKAARNA